MVYDKKMAGFTPFMSFPSFADPELQALLLDMAMAVINLLKAENLGVNFALYEEEDELNLASNKPIESQSISIQ